MELQAERVNGFYPGTNRPILPRQQTHRSGPAVAVEDEISGWDAKPYLLAVQGFPREFFTIGHLSAALHRSAMTIRGWESKGYFPKPTFTVNGSDRHARRRLYTREQVEGAMQIAQEEGLIDSRKRYLTETSFTPRVFALFAQCRDLPPPFDSKEKEQHS